ncbi:sel1 repeat family protein [Dyella sp. EPa41]|uniref:tetratricopeptide repeat protein n=1 Tax=Dyella sp. EPa41 TaxID=1561194 RepID=UPI001915C05F|nr:sel1 repeat family protein [Dyella sp. EPa41]
MAGKVMVVVLGLLVGAGHAASAQEAPTGQPVTDPKDLRELAKFEEMMDVPGVARQHKDILYRELAMEAYKNGDKERAFKMFMRAASYADKPSQAAIANMHWDGIGTPVDRPRAYAWMDLAASRGYDRFIAKREYYWSQLTEAERAQALRVGQDIYAEYDDKIALHRLQMELEFIRRNVVGSHVGSIGPGKVYGFTHTMNTGRASTGLPRPGGSGTPTSASEQDLGIPIANLNELYRPSLWKINDYAKFKDLQWQVRVESRPTVDVGDLQNVARPPAK